METMNDQIWYYEKDGLLLGPLHGAEIITLIREGGITGSTLIWAEPMETWAKAETLEEFGEHFEKAPSPLPSETVRAEVQTPPAIPPLPGSNSGVVSEPLPTEQAAFMPPVAKGDAEPEAMQAENPSSDGLYVIPYGVIPVIDGVSQVQPWNRFMAKMVDYHIILLGLYILLGVFLPSAISTNDAAAVTEIIFLWPIAGFLLILIEPSFINRYGKTPGKHIFGISVLKRDGSLPTYAEARTRAYNAWVNGFAFNFILLSWITPLYQYDRLIRNGITSWDRQGGFVTRHKESDFLLVCVVYIIFVLYLGYDFLNGYFGE